MSNNLVDENNVYLYTYTLIGMVNSVATFFRAFIFAYGGIKACQKIHNNLLTCVINVRIKYLIYIIFFIILFINLFFIII